VTGRPQPGRLPDPLLLGLLLAQPALYGAVLLLHHEDVATFGDLLVDRKARVAVPIHRFGHVPMWMLAVPALLWAVGWARLAWQGRAADRPEWALGAQVALYVTTVTALADQDPRAAVVVLLLLVAVEAVLGFAARERRLATAELVALCFAAVAASSALVAGVSAGADWAGWALIVTGVLTLVYGGAAGLVALGYLGSLIVSAGVDVLLSARDVGPVEAYSLPLAALLAAVGLWHWSRDRSLPTVVTMGPTLGVALMPTLLRAVADGDEVRLSVVTLVAIAVLLVGLLRRWKGPVTSGAVVLIVVAITQGGPLIAQLDYFVTAGVAGVLLLAVGVMWESAVVQGRRAATWYGQLR
jgi:hypothetical protein